MLTRRTLSGLPFAALARPALAQPARRALSVGVGGFTFAYLPLFVAQAAGAFAAEGLDVSFTQTGSGATAMAAMLSGSFDITGLVLSDVLLAVAKQQAIRVFAPLMTQYASDSIVATGAAARAGITPDLPLTERVKRMRGMTLAISGRGSGIDKMYRYLFKQAGLDPDRDVTLTVVKLDQMYPALRAGRIDGYNTTAPSNNRAVAEGLAVWAARPSQGEVPGLENFLYTVLAVTPDVLTRNQAVLARFTRGLSAGLALLHRDPAEAARAVHAAIWQQTELALLSDTIADQRSAFAPHMSLTRRAFEQNKQFMAGFGDEVAAVRFEDVMAPEFVESA